MRRVSLLDYYISHPKTIIFHISSQTNLDCECLREKRNIHTHTHKLLGIDKIRLRGRPFTIGELSSFHTLYLGEFLEATIFLSLPFFFPNVIFVESIFRD